MTGEHDPPHPLDGRWAVRREAGMLPPLRFVHKRIAGGNGTTRLGPVGLPFRVRTGPDGPELAYRGPLAPVRDRLHRRAEDVWGGETFLAGVRIGRFRMVRAGGSSPPAPGSR